MNQKIWSLSTEIKFTKLIKFWFLFFFPISPRHQRVWRRYSQLSWQRHLYKPPWKLQLLVCGRVRGRWKAVPGYDLLRCGVKLFSTFGWPTLLFRVKDAQNRKQGFNLEARNCLKQSPLLIIQSVDFLFFYFSFHFRCLNCEEMFRTCWSCMTTF